MILHVLRGLFIFVLAAVGWFFLSLGWVTFPIAMAAGILFVGIDVLTPRRKLTIFSGVLFGLLVGTLIAYALSFPVNLLVDQATSLMWPPPKDEYHKNLADFCKLVVAVISCYLTVSFTLQTKDDFRFIIPYVEFKRTTKGTRPFLLDTSALIDGRIEDIAKTGVIEAQLVVPQFVIRELQAVADSKDRTKRARGRRGLDVLTRLQSSAKPEVVLYAFRDDPEARKAGGDNEAPAGVDERLIELAQELSARVLTTDYNLNKVAQLRGVDVVNVNDLAAALRPAALPGDRMTVRIVKPGESASQGVGYLADGTMVVVEHGRSHLDEDVEFTVTSALQNSAGRMIFGRLAEPTSTDGPTAPNRVSSASV